MLKYIRTILSALLASTTLFLAACTGSVTEAGDRLEGKGSATIAQNGDIQGSGEGKSHSRQNGEHDDDDDHDDGHHQNRALNFKMKDATDKIVCTAASGAVTVHGRGDTINKTSTTTCVVTPASQVPGATTTGSGTTTTGSGTTTSGSGTTTAGSGTDPASKAKNSF